MPASSPLDASAAPADPKGLVRVVAIGASAGGLDACRTLLDALPARTKCAWIFVQHLDPAHESMMVELLAPHTRLRVRQITDGMRIEPENLYVIAPGTYVATEDGLLHVTRPQARHGPRLPFDFLLHSLAGQYGERAACVILSGTGADGAEGLVAIEAHAGLVIAQDPEEAGYDGMPRSAIATGMVDLVLPAAHIPGALLDFMGNESRSSAFEKPSHVETEPASEWLAEVVELLRGRTGQDFTLYKPGTLRRRIERRRALACVDAPDMARYLALLRRDAAELDRLARDLLINVTRFFRDPAAFEHLSDAILPDLGRRAAASRSIRVWVPGCSTGEEAYSLLMLLREQIAGAESVVQLQVFASDIDPHALAIAREGRYPASIEADVSAARLARFFSREQGGYRVLPDLRASIVFTVHDVLVNPPFSEIDLISCRNLLIYLNREAQARVVSAFHFALHHDAVLLLGHSETLADNEGRFEVLSEVHRLYRHVGRNRPRQAAFASDALGSLQAASPAGRAIARATGQRIFAGIAERALLDTYAPAAVLIDRNQQCLYFLGPADRFLRVPPGEPTHDLFALAPRELRARMRAAIQQVRSGNARVLLADTRRHDDGDATSFDVDIQPVPGGDGGLLLVCFVDSARRRERDPLPSAADDPSRVAELERELLATKTELEGALRSNEVSGEDQKAINEEALSVNEEYQSANEELLTSKEELQSLNEELTALNGQLQETLERQRTTSNDLQNVLYSTDVATLFLDTHLNIRFFTPATRLFFKVIPGDIGRPLADLSSLAADGNLLADARTVLRTVAHVEREIEVHAGVWFIRRILPYRTDDNGVEGVVITFTDITERKLAAKALEAARQHADQANRAKSRFLAAASHDLRQPLQTLALLQGALGQAVRGPDAESLMARLDQTVGAMTGMLNTLLDINQIEAGAVHAEMANLSVAGILGSLRDEFAYQAAAQGLRLRVAKCGLFVRSDPRLLAQVLRNLLSNALKYTREGGVLIGCRRHANTLRMEILDTGVGIPSNELEAIFDEYHQLDNAARERNRGLGLGLSIAQRLAELMGNRIGVRSQPGKGSVFSIEVALAASDPPCIAPAGSGTPVSTALPVVASKAAILVIEDEPDVGELLMRLLAGEGHRAVRALSGADAQRAVEAGMPCPGLILADYNLPNSMDGLEAASRLREAFGCRIPVIVLTGDISSATLRRVAACDCLQLTKPVKPDELLRAISGLLAAEPPATEMARVNQPGQASLVYIVDDDRAIREGIREILERERYVVEDFASSEAFLETYRPGRDACLLIDAYLPGMTGLELLRRLGEAHDRLPAVMITGNSDVGVAVQAMKAGAADFIEKPIGPAELIESIARVFAGARDSHRLSAWRDDAARHIADLTPRQRQVMELVLAGRPSKIIAADLGISQRTVENHRATIMKKTGSKSLPALTRLALAAASGAA